MRIDAHRHVWAISRRECNWLNQSLAAVYRDFAPADLMPRLAIPRHIYQVVNFTTTIPNFRYYRLRPRS